MFNRQIGNKFEEEFAKKLYDHGYWVHRITQNASGQPADIIAIKGRSTNLIDCKVCTKDYLDLSRIEENQVLAMTLFGKRAKRPNVSWFAIKLKSGDIYMFPWTMMELALEKGATRLSVNNIKDYGMPLDEWLRLDR